MKRVGGEIGGMALARRETTKLRVDRARSDPRRVDQRRAVDELDAGAAGRNRRAATLGVEARLRDPALAHEECDPHQIAAGRTARATDHRAFRHAAPATRIAQVPLETLTLHGKELRANAGGPGAPGFRA